MCGAAGISVLKIQDCPVNVNHLWHGAAGEETELCACLLLGSYVIFFFSGIYEVVE